MQINMLARIARIGAVCLALAASAASALAFEGKVEMKMVSGHDKKEVPLVYYIKGTHLRTEITPGGKQDKGGETFASIINMDSR